MSLGWHLSRPASSRSSGTTTAERHQLAYVVYVAAGAQIVGGVAIQFRRSANVGAATLAVVYLFFALLCVPGIVSAPRVYNSWGNFFEQLSLFTGAAIAYAWLSFGMVYGHRPADRPHAPGRLRRILCPRTGVLSPRYCNARSGVASARSDVLGHRDDRCLRTSGHCRSDESCRAFWRLAY